MKWPRASGTLRTTRSRISRGLWKSISPPLRSREPAAIEHGKQYQGQSGGEQRGRLGNDPVHGKCGNRLIREYGWNRVLHFYVSVHRRQSVIPIYGLILD